MISSNVDVIVVNVVVFLVSVSIETDNIRRDQCVYIRIICLKRKRSSFTAWNEPRGTRLIVGQIHLLTVLSGRI